MGRPTKLTPETVKRITEAIEYGLTYEHASAYGGIAYNTFNEWRKRGQAEAERLEASERTKPRDSETPYREFYEAVKNAESAGAFNLMLKIQSAATEGAWQAAAWILERRHPEQYGRQLIDNRISGEMDFNLEVNWITPDTTAMNEDD